MIPLTLMARKEMQDTGKPEDELMVEAISGAWKGFFDTRVLTRDYPPKEITPDKPGQKVELTCPAMRMLRNSQAQGSVEKIYEYVATHRQDLAGELKQVANAAQQITTKPSLDDGLSLREQRLRAEQAEHDQAGEVNQSGEATQHTADKSRADEGTPPAQCPMGFVRKLRLATALTGSLLVPGHDMPQPKHEDSNPKHVRKWTDDRPPAGEGKKLPPTPGRKP